MFIFKFIVIFFATLASIHSFGSKECRDSLLQRMRTPGFMKIGVAFGYSDKIDDGIDLVADSYNLNLFLKKAQRPCTDELQGFCGFQIKSGDANSVIELQKLLTFDDGVILQVQLYTVLSSYSYFNSQNQSKFKNQQNQMTQQARNFYGLTLREFDIAFYQGHSRDGGGPDFAPPLENSKGTVNYPWYRSNQPGFKWLLENLNSSPSEQPAILGLFSCASRGHFLKTLRKRAPETDLILSTKVVEAEKTLTGLHLSMDSLLRFDCPNTWHNRLKSNSTSFVLDAAPAKASFEVDAAVEPAALPAPVDDKSENEAEVRSIAEPQPN